MERGSYRQSVMDWGESGSFYPNMLPDEGSVAQLRVVQSKLLEKNPEIKLIDNLHMTLFYCRPRTIYQYIKENIDSDVRPEYLYSDLAGVFPFLSSRKVSLPVEGIERFGDDGSVIALKMGRTATFSHGLHTDRELILRNIRRHGVTNGDIDIMREMPEFKWLLSESDSHISLAHDSGITALPNIELPKSINFKGLSAGSAKADCIDPLRWYLMPESLDD